jgi:hypothetical protein
MSLVKLKRGQYVALLGIRGEFSIHSCATTSRALCPKYRKNNNFSDPDARIATKVLQLDAFGNV